MTLSQIATLDINAMPTWMEFRFDNAEYDFVGEIIKASCTIPLPEQPTPIDTPLLHIAGVTGNAQPSPTNSFDVTTHQWLKLINGFGSALIRIEFIPNDRFGERKPIPPNGSIVFVVGQLLRVACNDNNVTEYFCVHPTQLSILVRPTSGVQAILNNNNDDSNPEFHEDFPEVRPDLLKRRRVEEPAFAPTPPARASGRGGSKHGGRGRGRGRGTASSAAVTTSQRGCRGKSAAAGSVGRSTPLSAKGKGKQRATEPEDDVIVVTSQGSSPLTDIDMEGSDNDILAEESKASEIVDDEAEEDNEMCEEDD
ncbi:hypothetical protein PM082_010987 [Marasmius tenuissimus]|nr:hypothetical protein PM082_010987 [Marasmius tenuissimus]